ncbi:PREDICTED: uncharacterized protein LOC105363706 [Ceratosolen solmsi marchali]|uniref:Uncharacterized protein LOC105363706 n=1 Tax=Ceratosolen solmsi marchali TaxID=326594 RepID=A0AAJ6YKH3_9HYME|nr:PREDICTED: uncharacterized protein LOC105363706 [Ceratosolen solmsi marchali]
MLNLGAYSLLASINTMVFGSNKFHIKRSQSKASYLAYRRERGAPDSEGSYKRTMSPNARLDDPVLLKVTLHQQQPLVNNNTSNPSHNNNNNNSSKRGGTERQEQAAGEGEEEVGRQLRAPRQASGGLL